MHIEYLIGGCLFGLVMFGIFGLAMFVGIAGISNDKDERQKQWNRLHEICKQGTYTSSSKIVIPADLVETIDDIEQLR